MLRGDRWLQAIGGSARAKHEGKLPAVVVEGAPRLSLAVVDSCMAFRQMQSDL